MAYSEPTITPFNPFNTTTTADLVHVRPFPTSPILFPSRPLFNALTTSTTTSTTTTSPTNPNTSNSTLNSTTTNTTHQQFHLFPHLPLELRLHIIHFTFPSHHTSTSHLKNRLVLARPHFIASRTRLNPLTNIIHAKTEFLFGSPTLPPVSLFVNAEWRTETLRWYRPCFGFRGEEGVVDGEGGKGNGEKMEGRMYFYCPPSSASSPSHHSNAIITSASKKSSKDAENENGDENRSEDEESSPYDESDVLYFEFTGTPFYSNLGYFTATILGEGCTRLDIQRITRIALSHRMIVGRPMALRKMVRRLELFENLREVIVVIERDNLIVNPSSGNAANATTATSSLPSSSRQQPTTHHPALASFLTTNTEETYINAIANGAGGMIPAAVNKQHKQSRIVGREARLVDLAPASEWDEETRSLVEELEIARDVWKEEGWRGRYQMVNYNVNSEHGDVGAGGGGNGGEGGESAGRRRRKWIVPKLRAMEFENLEEWDEGMRREKRGSEEEEDKVGSGDVDVDVDAEKGKENNNATAAAGGGKGKEKEKDSDMKTKLSKILKRLHFGKG